MGRGRGVGEIKAGERRKMERTTGGRDGTVVEKMLKVHYRLA